jgi:hypothetical protein
MMAESAAVPRTSGFWGTPWVSNEDLKALIMAAEAFSGPGVLVPTTNAALSRWCLDQGLRVNHLMSLMTIGLYAPPRGTHLPCVL